MLAFVQSESPATIEVDMGLEGAKVRCGDIWVCKVVCK